MNFQRGRIREEPEINLIAMIDVLLVILIFMVVTTTYSQLSTLQINLPQATGDKAPAQTNSIQIAVDGSDHYAVNNVAIPYRNIEGLAQALQKAAGSQTDPTIVINADAKATHQSVINIMEAARVAGYGSITFTTSQNK